MNSISREVFDNIPLPPKVTAFPELRYMGSKHRLLPWLHGVLRHFGTHGAVERAEVREYLIVGQ